MADKGNNVSGVGTRQTEKNKTDSKIADKRKLPFPCMVLEHSEEITNKFSGEKVMLPPDAVAVYDTIKGAELVGNDDHLRKGLDWFIKNEPDAYMVLLD